MAGDYGDELSRIFEQPDEPPSMEELLANTNLLADDEPQQVPPAAHLQHPGHPVAIDPHVQPVDHPANAVIHEQHAQPPAMGYLQQYQHVPPATQHFEQHQHMPGEVPPATQHFQHQQMLGVQVPPATQFEQYHQMPGDVPPATHFQQYQQGLGAVPPESTQYFQQFQVQQIPGEGPPPTQYQQMPGNFAPSTMPLHHQQILAELSPAALPPEAQQMLQDFPPSRVQVHHQQMPVHHQPTLADLSAEAAAAVLPVDDEHTQSEPSQPVQHQHVAHESTPPAVPLGDSSRRNICNDDEELDIDAFLMGEGLASDDDNSMEENSSAAGDGDADGYLMDYALQEAEETAVFVPISQDQLHCHSGNCHVVGEVRHVNGRLSNYFTVHRDGNDGRFAHAIVTRMYNGVHGHNNSQELMLLDLSRRTHAWVLRFMARTVETMRNGAGTVTVNMPGGGGEGGSGEGGSSSSASAAAATAFTDEAEIDMLCELFATWATAVNPEAAAPAPAPAPAPEAAPSPSPAQAAAERVVFEANRVLGAAQASDAAAADPTQYPSSARRRQQREKARHVTAEEEEEIRQSVRLAREEAEMDMRTRLPGAIKKICFKNRDNRNLLDTIRGNNKKLVRLQKSAMRRSGKDLLGMKELGEMYLQENRGLYEALVREVRRRQREEAGDGRCAPRRKKDDGSGPSGGGGGGSGSAGGCAPVS